MGGQPLVTEEGWVRTHFKQLGTSERAVEAPHLKQFLELRNEVALQKDSLEEWEMGRHQAKDNGKALISVESL